MSHYTRHLPVSVGGNPRVGLLGGGIVGVGLLGFFAYLSRKHDQKLQLDRSGKPSTISSWETRIMNQNVDTSLPTTTTIRASRIETRSTPIPAVKTEHDAHHRTFSEERAFAAERPASASSQHIYEVPTAQRDGNDGFVYTKAPDWYKKGTVKKAPADANESEDVTTRDISVQRDV